MKIPDHKNAQYEQDIYDIFISPNKDDLMQHLQKLRNDVDAEFYSRKLGVPGKKVSPGKQNIHQYPQ